jgi:hypothetical protein
MLAGIFTLLAAREFLSATWQLFSKPLLRGFSPSIRPSTHFPPYACSLMQFNSFTRFPHFTHYGMGQWRGFQGVVPGFKPGLASIVAN